MTKKSFVGVDEAWGIQESFHKPAQIFMAAGLRELGASASAIKPH